MKKLAVWKLFCIFAANFPANCEVFNAGQGYMEKKNNTHNSINLKNERDL